MSKKEKQLTLAKDITLEGIGVHTGIKSKITIKPAEEGHGIKFKRIDLENQPVIDAVAENVVDTRRSTSIEKNGVKVGTIEHLMASLYGMKIDNALIEINGPEVPILDGSAKYFVQAIQKVGTVEQAEKKHYFVIKNSIDYTDEERAAEIVTFPDDDFSVHVMIEYKTAVIGHQYATLNSIDEFATQIAPAKTFILLSEVEYLFDNNLIKGGTLENAIIILEKDITQERLDKLAEKLGKPRIKLNKTNGVLNEEILVFNNEPARHKLLDLIGDLALVGMPIKGKILATRPGHTTNIEFAKKIRQEIKRQKLKGLLPDVDLNASPVMDINKIRTFLPHAYPFLFVDKVVYMDKEQIVGIKNITYDQYFFAGHFPHEPIMPGVLMIEAMAQTGGLLVLKSVDEPQRYSSYFLKIDKVKFKRKVVPGDSLIMHMQLIEPIRRGIVVMQGRAFVRNELAVEGIFTAQIVKNR